ncbi:unnamed protein product [Ceratitis capitata]|uniref:(Mediterranean fruit fly) hypothetical protein n=1 Tax=Ceratitis capitata TaxID=7213 RepID=A0A811V4F7_CERCA|nr:unnamed protein product [Ceratitis capitata]
MLLLKQGLFIFLISVLFLRRRQTCALAYTASEDMTMCLAMQVCVCLCVCLYVFYNIVVYASRISSRQQTAQQWSVYANRFYAWLALVELTKYLVQYSERNEE